MSPESTTRQHFPKENCESPKQGEAALIMSPKHLDQYVTEFSGRHNIHEADTEDAMSIIARQSVGKRLGYRELIADNELDSGARA